MQNKITEKIDVPGSILTYAAEGNGDPLVIFTGGENMGQKIFPKEKSPAVISFSCKQCCASLDFNNLEECMINSGCV